MGTNAYSIGQGIHNVRTIGQLLGGVLGMPNQVQQGTQQAEAMRALLPQLMPGMTPEQASALAPQPGMQFLNPDQGGTLGKILGGVGDVGTIMQTLTGGAGPSSPPISLEVLSALTGRQLDREKFANLQGYRQQRLDMEDRRTKATETQADAALIRANKTSGDAAGTRQADDRARRLAMVDQMGLKLTPTETARWLEKGMLPKNAPDLSLDTFYKLELGRTNPVTGKAPAPDEAMKRAYQALGIYQRGRAKVQKKVAAQQDAANNPLTIEFDSSKLSAPGQIAAERIFNLVHAQQMDPETAARKIAQLK